MTALSFFQVYLELKAINDSTEDMYPRLLIVPNDKWEFMNVCQTIARARGKRQPMWDTRMRSEL